VPICAHTCFTVVVLWNPHPCRCTPTQGLSHRLWLP
jgi:hypothetical protein